MSGNALRVLKILTVVMGVMILGGTAVLIAVIFHRATAPAAPPASASASASAPQSAAASAPVALTLDEPAGSHIAGMTATQDRLAVQVQGGGPDRIVLIDPHTGTVAGRITLAH